jgi:hypothetical protein
MVDVVVDQKVIEKLPYDPNDIPESVRKRAAAVDALYQPDGQQLPEAAASQSPAAQPAPLPMPPSPPAVSAPAVDLPGDDDSADWKHRFARMQGRNTALQKQIGEMQEQMEQLGSELLHAQQRRAPRPEHVRAPPPQPNFLTQEDEQAYGPELLDVAQRAALQAVAPKLHQVETQNAELQRQLAKERRRALDQAVELAVPDFREIDRNPRWHRWLLGIDVLSGRVRQQLLNEAIASAAAPRVISFFNGFKQEEAATGHIESEPVSHQAAPPREPAVSLASLAAPGRARPASGGDTSLPPDKPIYTRAQIKELYSLHRRGAYVGREADWNRLDLDIIAAGREGRIR